MVLPSSGAGTDQHRQRVGTCRKVGIGAAVGDFGVQQAVGFLDVAAQRPPRPEPLQVRARDRERCPRGHVEQLRHHLAQRRESSRVGCADDGPQDHLEGDLGHLGGHREVGVHRPRRDIGRGDLGHHAGLPRDRVAVECGQHLAPSLPMHVVVDHQHGAGAEQAAQHRIRFTGVVDAGTAREHLLDLRGIVQIHQCPHGGDPHREHAAVPTPARRYEARPITGHQCRLHRGGQPRAWR